MAKEDTSHRVTAGYTAEQLERETGFDRRTIAFYVQQGLLPRVGRRGPRTRYPQLVMDRLRFIRRVREAEALGEVAPITLSGIRRIFEQSSPELIAMTACGEHPVPQLMAGVRRAALERQMAPERGEGSGNVPRSPAATHRPLPGTNSWSGLREGGHTDGVDERSASAHDLAGSASTEERELSDALAELQARARQRRLESSEPYERWSSVELSPNISLLVRGATDEDTELLDDVSRRLRQLIRRRKQTRD